MKKQIFKTFALFSLLLGAGFWQVVSAQASSRVVVNVPFSFVVSGESLPAGSYEISRLSAYSEKALLIRSLGGDRRVAVLTETGQTGLKIKKSQISFRQYGDLFFLAEVRTAGTNAARDVLPSRAEKELQRKKRPRVAQTQGAGEEHRTVVITGSVR
jgi:hypothetical protein